jgi:hypothetical protein
MCSQGVDDGIITTMGRMENSRSQQWPRRRFEVHRGWSPGVSCLEGMGRRDTYSLVRFRNSLKNDRDQIRRNIKAGDC